MIARDLFYESQTEIVKRLKECDCSQVRLKTGWIEKNSNFFSTFFCANNLLSFASIKTDARFVRFARFL